MKVHSFLLLCIVTAQMLFAQSPEYATSKNLKLNYRETTSSTVEIKTPQGKIPVTTYHNASITIHFTADDSASASYDALTISLETAQGKMEPETDSLIGEAFLIHFPSDGRIQTIKTPAFPESFQGVTNLRWQFWDFFLPLPALPLEDGLVWTDTLRTDKDEAQMMEKSGRYEVVGDTVISGIPAKVIASQIESRIEASGPGPGPGITAVSKLTGLERGEFYFSSERGMLVGRERIGDLEGELIYEGGPQSMVLPQLVEYKSTISLITM